MANTVKYKDDYYFDSTGVMHDRKLLSNVLNNHETDINSLKYDTGWVNLTLTSAFKAYNNNSDHNPKYRRIGNMVMVRGCVSPTSSSNSLGSSTDTVMATLPTDLKPARDIYTICQGSSTCIWLFGIYSNGKLIASRYRDGASYSTPGTSVWMPFYITYFIN